jgi:hypothetical protein
VFFITVIFNFTLNCIRGLTKKLKRLKVQVQDVFECISKCYKLSRVSGVHTSTCNVKLELPERPDE